MRAMGSAQEFGQAPPTGRYLVQFDAVEATNSAKGESMLKITGSIADGPHKGSIFFHNLGTDGGTKFGAMGKKHFRALGVSVDADYEVPDSVLASKLQGLRLYAELGHEPREKKLEGSNGQTVAVMQYNATTQKQEPVMNLAVLAYIREPGARIDLGLPGQQLAPTGQPGFVPQQGAPQQGYATAPQGMPPGAPPFPGGGYPPAGAPGAYPPGAPGGWNPSAPPPGAPQFAPPNAGFVPGAAAPVWGGPQNGAPQGAPGAAPGGAPGQFPPNAGVRPG